MLQTSGGASAESEDAVCAGHSEISPAARLSPIHIELLALDFPALFESEGEPVLVKKTLDVAAELLIPVKLAVSDFEPKRRDVREHLRSAGENEVLGALHVQMQEI